MQLAWKWWSSYRGDGPNDYFMWGDESGIAVGGAGGYVQATGLMCWHIASRMQTGLIKNGHSQILPMPMLCRYALWLDNELGKGLTRSCLTFGSPPLGPQEEFDIGSVELWWLK